MAHGSEAPRIKDPSIALLWLGMDSIQAIGDLTGEGWRCHPDQGHVAVGAPGRCRLDHDPIGFGPPRLRGQFLRAPGFWSR